MRTACHRAKTGVLVWRFLFWPALLSLLLLAGCGARSWEIEAAYDSARRASLPEARGVNLYMAPVEGPEDRLWYETGSRRWYLERPPTELVREALVQGMEFMGLRFTEHPALADGRLEARIRWFAPYGHSPFAAVVIVSLSLHGGEGAQFLWWGRIRAGRDEKPKGMGVFGGREELGKVLSEVLTEAVDQLRWKPEFRHALRCMRSIPSAG
ncbi:MAG: hypothetical protein K9M82_04595 [Deltaproteobacteria bacterium]|nr:hypothetical protein [Deltaproteobacteria bacterium]